MAQWWRTWTVLSMTLLTRASAERWPRSGMIQARWTYHYPALGFTSGTIDPRIRKADPLGGLRHLLPCRSALSYAIMPISLSVGARPTTRGMASGHAWCQRWETSCRRWATERVSPRRCQGASCPHGRSFERCPSAHPGTPASEASALCLRCSGSSSKLTVRTLVVAPRMLNVSKTQDSSRFDALAPGTSNISA
jgi:hypothetical protein